MAEPETGSKDAIPVIYVHKRSQDGGRPCGMRSETEYQHNTLANMSTYLFAAKASAMDGIW